MTKAIAIVVLLVLGAVGTIAQEQLDTSVTQTGTPSTPVRLALTADIQGYMNNLEYFNQYREGNFYLGGDFALRARYTPHAQLTFALGFFGRKAIGDERFLSDIRPLFLAQFESGVFVLRIGELDWQGRHGLPDAVMREQYDYEKGVEEGFSMSWRWPAVGWELWAAYDSLNTQLHREHLRFGSVTALDLAPLAIKLLGHWDHYGGQNYAPAGDPVRDNWIGGCEIAGVVPVQNVVDEIGVKVIMLGSATTPDRGEIDFSTGWGVISRAWISIRQFELLLQYYRGRDFETWQGNPMYRANIPYYQVQLSRQREFDGGAKLDWGIRADLLGNDLANYTRHFEHQVWVRLSGSFLHHLL